jgi:hypothetical protein
MDPQLVTAITALVVALTTLLTTAVTLAKVFQHDTILQDTRTAVNGQATELHAVTQKNTQGLDRLDAGVTRMEAANDTAARARVIP